MRRVLLLALAVMAGIVVGLAGAVTLRGRALAEAAVQAALSRAGIAATVEVRSVSLVGMTLGPLHLGSDGPAVAGVELDWSPLGLLRGRIARARIDGLRLDVAIEDSGLRVHGLPASSGGAAGLPVAQVELTDARIKVHAAAGKAIATVAGSLMQDQTGWRGQAMIDATVTPRDDEPIHLIAEVPTWRFDHARRRIELDKAAVRLPAQGIGAEELDATADLAAGFRLTGRLRDISPPVDWPPLTLALDGRRGRDTLVIAGTAQGVDRALALRLKANHRISSGHGKAEIELTPIGFQPNGRQPADLLPVLGRDVHHVEGRIGAQGTLSWGGKFDSTLRLDLASIGFDSGSAQLRALNGRIALQPAWPPRATAPQRLTAQLAVAGLPAGALELVFTLPEPARLRLERASYGLAGGKLALAGVTLERDAPVDTAIAVEAIDLGAALALLGIDGLSGSGRIDGRLPVHIDTGGVAIRDGALAAQGPGTLRYTGHALPSEITGLQGEAGDAVRLAQQALTDFRYDALKLTVNRAADGSGSLLLNLSGNNPAVLDGHPFVLNIRLETNFDRLALLLLDGYAAAEGMLRRAAGP